MTLRFIAVRTASICRSVGPLLLGAAFLGAACDPPEYFRNSPLAPSDADIGIAGQSGSGGAGAGGVPGTGGTIVFTTGGVGGGPADPGTGGVGTGGSSTGGSGTGGRGTGGSGTGGRGTGGAATGGAATGGAGTGGAGTGGRAPADPARYNFEANQQSWLDDVASARFSNIATSTAQRFAGTSSLAGTFNATGGAFFTLVVSPPISAGTGNIPAGTTVTYHVFVPPTSAAPAQPIIDYVTPFVQEGPGVGVQGFVWTGNGQIYAPGTWNTFTVTVPNPLSAGASINVLGVQFHTTGVLPSTTVYVDSISY